MKQSLITFNPNRDYLMQRVLKLRAEHPDTFAAAWGATADMFGYINKMDINKPHELEFICVSFRMWLLHAKLMPPSLSHMGPKVNGMILVDMDRLGEPPPSLWSLVTGEDDRDFPENDDE